MLSTESKQADIPCNQGNNKIQSDIADISFEKKNVLFCKSALFISILTLIIVSILFYSLSRNMHGIANNMINVETVKQQMDSLDMQVETISKKLESLENYAASQKLTEKALRSAMRKTLIDQAASQLEYVVNHLQQDAGDAELRAAIALIQKKRSQKRQPTEPEPAP